LIDIEPAGPATETTMGKKLATGTGILPVSADPVEWDAALLAMIEPVIEDETHDFLISMTEHERLDRRRGPELSAGDVDARWDQAESSGEETAGGSVATPDQSVVDEIGLALGIVYQADEPLRPGDKKRDRDRHRWELDPASSEDYTQREFRNEHLRRRRSPE
jgi:hypothetical protein